jgi:hypothetical protein
LAAKQFADVRADGTGNCQAVSVNFGEELIKNGISRIVNGL